MHSEAHSMSKSISWAFHSTAFTAKNILQPNSKHQAKQESQSWQLALIIHTNAIGLYPPQQYNMTDNLVLLTIITGPPTPNPPSTHTCLLSGTLAKFTHYSYREHAQWLIDIAHDICDPYMKHGFLQVWNEPAETWRNVNPNDHLISSFYLYRV